MKRNITIFVCIAICLHCSALDFGISFSPMLSHYEAHPVSVDINENDLPWTNGIGIQLYHLEHETYRFYSQLAYNNGNLAYQVTSPIDGRDYFISPGTVSCFEYSFNFSYDIKLSSHIYLNPEIGLALQLPFLSMVDSYGTEPVIIQEYHGFPTPTVGVNASLWLAYEFKNKERLKLGICSYLPFYRTELGSYTMNNRTESVMSGLGYLGFGISYVFKTKQ